MEFLKDKIEEIVCNFKLGNNSKCKRTKTAGKQITTQYIIARPNVVLISYIAYILCLIGFD